MDTDTPSHWLGVVSAEHVRRGVRLGIAQIGHGRRSGLDRMRPGDWLVYYSPRERLGDTAMLQEFTAVGQVADGEVWQADEGTFRPFRRRVDYVAEVSPVSVRSLDGHLDLTGTSSWGAQLRRALIPLSEHDFAVIRDAMTSVPA